LNRHSGHLSKFVWILQNKAIYFSRIDQLGDSHEDYYTEPMASPDYFLSNLKIEKLLPEEIKQNPIAYESCVNTIAKIFLGKHNSPIYVSCWHMNEDESPAMWKLYTSHGDSICIKSTYNIIDINLPRTYCYIGCVKYINYRHDVFDVRLALNYIIHKLKSFEHEKEVRAVIPYLKIITRKIKVIADKKGLLVPIDLSKLVQQVFVSPHSKPIFFEIVKGLLETYGLNVPVLKSEMNAPPSF
jgi:hypothetical protein